MLDAELPDVVLFGSAPRFGDMCIHAAVDLRRSFPTTAIERAVEATAAAFPVLGSRYEPGFVRDRWVPVEGPVSGAVHVVDAPVDLEMETLAWARCPIEVTRARPIRVVSLGRRGGSRLILSLSHLAVDGAGMAAVAHVFGAHLQGAAPSLPVDRRRDTRPALGRLRWYHAPALARQAAAQAVQPLRMLAAGRRERPYPAGAPGQADFRHVAISAEDLDRLKAAAPGATVNDLLVAALARAAARRSSHGPVPVLYTMDLRRYASSPRLTAANTSSILSVLVPRDALSDLPSAAAAVAAVTRRHREDLAGPAFLLAPTLLAAGAPHAWVRRVVPALHPVLVDLPMRRGLLLTNVGKIDEGMGVLGDEVEDLRVIGPSITGVPIPLVVAFGFRGRLYLELFGPPGLSTGALAELEGEIREGLDLDGGRGKER
jgi:NRPS condensation-like uncharacterized protein